MREWGPELWDAVDKVDNRINDRLAKNERAIKFMKEKCSIDTEYSKQMKRLVTRYQKNTPNESEVTIDHAFIGLVSETHDIANQYEQIAEQIMTDCIQGLNSFNQEMTSMKKELFNEYKKHCKTLEDMDKDVDKTRLNWERKCRDYEKAKQQFEKADQDQNVTKADVEKSRSNSHQRRQLAEDAKNEYANRLVKFNEQQKSHHYELIPSILNNYQSIYMKNIDEFRVTVQKFCTSEEKYRPLIERCIAELRTTSEHINKETDSEHIIDTLKTGYTPPEDKPFEDMESEQHQPKHAKRKTLGGFGLFHSKPEKPPQDDMSHLPPQQRKRQLQKMKKETDKDIDKEEKELLALNKMANVDNFGDAGKLQESIRAAEVRLGKLKLHLDKVNEWMGSNKSPNMGKKNSPGLTRKPEVVIPVTSHVPPATHPVRSISKAPSNYASPISLAKRKDSFDDDSDDGLIHADCLYDFTEDGEGCIAVVQGMTLIVTEEDTGDGWTKVKIPTTGREGFVPTSYISTRLP